MRMIGMGLLVMCFYVATTALLSVARRAERPVAQGPESTKGASREKHPPRFTIGKETTYVTSPVDKDGYIDYAAALNERLRRGITPESNANVLIWKAIGPRPLGAPMPSEYFRWLGMEAPQERGDYFIDLTRYVKDHLKFDLVTGFDELFNRLVRGSERPWRAKEQPELAAWLKVNAKPLAVVVEAVKRPHYFSPLVPERTKRGGGLVSARLPPLQICREFAVTLAARAMLHVGENRPDRAWQDLLACHRLGRLVGRGSMSIEGLVGVAVDAIASRADLAFLECPRVDAKRIERCLRDLRDLRALPPLPRMLERFLGERLLLLDSMQLIHRHGLGYLDVLSDRPPNGPPSVFAEASLKDIEWDLALQIANQWYDRLETALREKERAVRQKKLNEYETDLIALKKRIVDEKEAAFLVVAGSPRQKGKVLGEILVGLFMPVFQMIQQAEDRTRQIEDNLAVAFGLAWYQRDHGSYPAKLEALNPKYLKQVPKDLFSGKALLYHPSRKGYLLYSVGPNGKDEGGRGYGDTPPGDDLGVRMPWPALPWK